MGLQKTGQAPNVMLETLSMSRNYFQSCILTGGVRRGAIVIIVNYIYGAPRNNGFKAPHKSFAFQFLQALHLLVLQEFIDAAEMFAHASVSKFIDLRDQSVEEVAVV